MAMGDPPSIVDMTNDTLEALDLVRKLTGELALTEQRLRDLVEAATKAEDSTSKGFTEHATYLAATAAIFDMRISLDAARKLLEAK